MKKNALNKIKVDDKMFRCEKTITVQPFKKQFHSGKRLKYSLFVMTVLPLLFITRVTSAQDMDNATRTVMANSQGKEVTITLSQYQTGRKLFNVSCAECHAGGVTKTNEQVTLSAEHLARATPIRNNIEGLIDFMKNPTTTDGETDISMVHPSKASQDIFTSMRSLKDSDLSAIAGYILVEIKRLGKKWGPYEGKY